MTGSLVTSLIICQLKLKPTLFSSDKSGLHCNNFLRNGIETCKQAGLDTVTIKGILAGPAWGLIQEEGISIASFRQTSHF